MSQNNKQKQKYPINKRASSPLPDSHCCYSMSSASSSSSKHVLSPSNKNVKNNNTRNKILGRHKQSPSNKWDVTAVGECVFEAPAAQHLEPMVTFLVMASHPPTTKQISFDPLTAIKKKLMIPQRHPKHRTFSSETNPIWCHNNHSSCFFVLFALFYCFLPNFIFVLAQQQTQQQQQKPLFQCASVACPADLFSDHGLGDPVYNNNQHEGGLSSLVLFSSLTPCTQCAQCTDNGLSMCIVDAVETATRPMVDPNKELPVETGCRCAMSVPVGCSIAATSEQSPNRNGNKLFTVCHLPALKALPPPEAMVIYSDDYADEDEDEDENGEPVPSAELLAGADMLEVTWDRVWADPYWRGLGGDSVGRDQGQEGPQVPVPLLLNATLFFEFPIKNDPTMCNWTDGGYDGRGRLELMTIKYMERMNAGRSPQERSRQRAINICRIDKQVALVLGHAPELLILSASGGPAAGSPNGVKSVDGIRRGSDLEQSNARVGSAEREEGMMIGSGAGGSDPKISPAEDISLSQFHGADHVQLYFTVKLNLPRQLRFLGRQLPKIIDRSTTVQSAIVAFNLNTNQTVGVFDDYQIVHPKLGPAVVQSPLSERERKVPGQRITGGSGDVPKKGGDDDRQQPPTKQPDLVHRPAATKTTVLMKNLSRDNDRPDADHDSEFSKTTTQKVSPTFDTKYDGLPKTGPGDDDDDEEPGFGTALSTGDDEYRRQTPGPVQKVKILSSDGPGADGAQRGASSGAGSARRPPALATGAVAGTDTAGNASELVLAALAVLAILVAAGGAAALFYWCCGCCSGRQQSPPETNGRATKPAGGSSNEHLLTMGVKNGSGTTGSRSFAGKKYQRAQ